MSRGDWVQKRVLILVKTYPNPSTKYNEVVCTAGIDTDTGAWIRLYPIPFRSLDGDQLFRKWQFVDLKVRRATGDPRRESFEVAQDSITPGDVIEAAGNGWASRWEYVAPLLVPSLDYVKGLPETERPSICMLKPAKYSLIIKPHAKPEYTAAEQGKLLGHRGFTTLFDRETRRGKLLEKIPLKFQYRFRCASEGCTKDHTALFEDWEIGEAWRKWRHTYTDPTILENKLRERFVDVPRKHENLYLVLGTHSAPFLDTWLTIGAFQPRLPHRSDTSQLSFPLT